MIISLPYLFQQAFFFGRIDLLSFCLTRADLYLQQGLRSLFPAHDGDAGCRPGIDEAGIIRLAAHGIVARAIGIADDDRDLRDYGIGDGIDHFCAVLDDAGMFAAGTYHEPRNVLQEDKGYFFLVAVQNETGRLVRAVVINDAAHLHFPFPRFDDLALIGDDADCPSIDTGIAAEDSFPVVFLEVFKNGIVRDTGNDVHHIVGFRGVGREDAIEFFCRMQGRGGGRPVEDAAGRRVPHFGKDVPYLVETLFFRLELIIGDPGYFGVRDGAAQCFGVDVLANSRLYEVRAGQEDRTVTFHHQRFVAHDREICAARNTGTHHGRNLGDAHGAHTRIVPEDAPEMFFVGEDLVLHGQENTGAVDNIDHR